MSLKPIKKVLVAMDGSERSYEIIHYITRTRLFAHQNLFDGFQRHGILLGLKCLSSRC